MNQPRRLNLVSSQLFAGQTRRQVGEGQDGRLGGTLGKQSRRLGLAGSKGAPMAWFQSACILQTVCSAVLVRLVCFVLAVCARELSAN